MPIEHPISTNCASLLVDFFRYSYGVVFIDRLLKQKQENNTNIFTSTLESQRRALVVSSNGHQQKVYNLGSDRTPL